MNPHLLNARIDFRHALIPPRGLCFRGFEQVLVAHGVDDVLPCIAAVEAAAGAGRYAVGFLAYEAAPAFDRAFEVRATTQPLAVFGLAASAGEAVADEPGEFRFGDWRAAWAPADHGRAIDAILAAVRAGESYQANLTFPLTTSFAGSIEACYRELLLAQDADYCGLLSGPDFSVLSASPELFFERRGDTLRTRPMKGTRRRGLTLADDRRMAQDLAHSAKDRAENVMIVDLLRNDLGRVAVPGSVTVERLFDIERYPTVWQMTSTVRAGVRAGTTLTEILAALFPCGSVTGAPKISTMKLLSRLETSARGPYCGAFGVVLPGGDCVFNVPIRTLVLSEGNRTARYAVGSGVVADSDPAQEYEECLVKARVLQRRPTRPFALFETLRWTPETGFVRLQGHLHRLLESAEYFGFRCDAQAVATDLCRRAGRWTVPTRVRLVLARDGSFSAETAPLPAADGPILLKLAEHPVLSTDCFLYHKTTRREVYERERARLGEAGDAVLYNERGQVTETTIANIALRLDGEWVTPPVHCGLLPGVLRGELIGQGLLKERVVSVDEARQARELRVLNSLRGEVSATWL